MAAAAHSFARFFGLNNMPDVTAELLSALLLWQVAPFALLLFISGAFGSGTRDPDG